MYKLIFIAPFRDVSGYGHGARDFLKSLDVFISNNPGLLSLKLHTLRFDQQDAITKDDEDLICKYEFKDETEIEHFISDKDYIVIGYLTLNTLTDNGHIQIYNNNAKAVFSMTVWETSHLPKIWKEGSKDRRIKGFIVPCKWNQEVFASDTGKPTYILHNIINDVAINDANYKSPFNSDVFNILTVSQWTLRKGFDILIMAYLMEFHNVPDVLLTIKSYRANSDKSEQEIIKKDIANYRKRVNVDIETHSNAKISFIGDLLSRSDMDRLYYGADLFALSTRGEGQGLPYTEALMHETPVLCPDKGGHIDYMDFENNYIVDGYWEPCHSLGTFYDSTMEWYVPTIKSTRLKLREAYNDWKSGKIKERGKKAKQHTLSLDYDADTVVNQFYELVVQLSNK